MAYYPDGHGSTWYCAHYARVGVAAFVRNQLDAPQCLVIHVKALISQFWLFASFCSTGVSHYRRAVETHIQYLGLSWLSGSASTP